MGSFRQKVLLSPWEFNPNHQAAQRRCLNGRLRCQCTIALDLCSPLMERSDEAARPVGRKFTKTCLGMRHVSSLAGNTCLRMRRPPRKSESRASQLRRLRPLTSPFRRKGAPCFCCTANCTPVGMNSTPANLKAAKIASRVSRLPRNRPSICSMRATVRYEMPALSARSSRDQFRSARAAFTWRTLIIAIAVRGC
jgi:hypothetical protein